MKKVNWVKWSSIAEIISSVAIVATLVYLSIQTQQNTDAIRANARDTIIDTDLQVLELLITDPGIWLSMSKPELTKAEQVKLSNFLIATIRTREHQWFQYQNGVLDQQIWESYLGGLSNTLSYPRTRVFWETIGSSGFNKDFVLAVDEFLLNIPLLSEDDLWLK